MLTLKHYLTLAISIAVLSLSFGGEVADSNLQISYIGSTGYLLESANKKILVDPTYGDIVQSFQYPYANLEAEGKIQNAEVPFDEIDLILITHVHLGHFDAAKTLACLANTNAKLITTQGVADSLEATSDNYSLIEDQIYVPDIDTYTMFDTTFSEIPLTITKIDHWGETELLQYSFTMDGLELAYYLDYSQQDGQDHHIKTSEIDLAILDGDVFLDNTKREMFKSDFDYGYTIFTHFTSMQTMADRIEENKTDCPNVAFMPNSMDILNFDFTGDSYTIDTINQAPVISEAVQNDTVLVGESFSIDFSDMASDPDDDEFMLSIIQGNGKDLPDWITFDESTSILSGTSTEAQMLSLSLTACDVHNAWTKKLFRLVFKEASSSIKPKSELDNIKIYPTIASNTLTIDLSESANSYSKLTIINSVGTVLTQSFLNQKEKIDIDVTKLPKGMYFIKIEGNTMVICQSFMKQ